MPPDSDRVVLGWRELEALDLLSHGYTWAGVQAYQNVKEATARTRIKKVYRKLSARNAGHAVRIGFERQLLTACPDECEMCQRAPNVRGLSE